MTFWPSTLPPDPIFNAIAARVLAAAGDHMDKEWSDMSEKPSGVAAAQAAANDIGLALNTVEGFEPKKLPQWEMVGKDTDGTPVYRNNWGGYGQWIPVGERLPENFCDVLVTNGISYFLAYCSKVPEYDTPLWNAHSIGRCHPTHWMPVPGPPEAKP